MRQSLSNSNIKKQKGATFLGMIIIGSILIFAAIVAIKMAPAYIEFLSVKKVLQAMGQEPLNNMGKKDIKDSFTRRAMIDDIKSVSSNDLVIEKEQAGTIVSIHYQVIKPVMGNVSVLLDFSASSK